MKKRVSILLITAITAALFTACGDSKKASGSGSAQSSATDSAAAVSGSSAEKPSKSASKASSENKTSASTENREKETKAVGEKNGVVSENTVGGIGDPETVIENPETVIDQAESKIEEFESADTDEAVQIAEGDTIELSGTVAVEEDNSSPNQTTTQAILILDRSFDCYIRGTNYDGKKLYKIDSVQIGSEYKDKVGEHVTVSGKVITAHTAHHLRDIVLG